MKPLLIILAIAVVAWPSSVVSQGRGPAGSMSVPDLSLPPGAKAFGRSGYATSATAGSAEWLATTQPAAEVAQHYEQQLAGLGWRETARQRDPNLLTARFLTEAGGTRVGTLKVMALEGGQILVTVRLAASTLSPATTGRRGGGGASERAGSTSSRASQIDIDTLMRSLPPPLSAESFASKPVLPEGFPIEALPAGFKPTTILVSPSRTTVGGIWVGATPSQLGVVLAAMRKAGWMEPTVFGGFFFDTATAELCRADKTAELSFAGRADGVVVGVSVGNTDRATSCGSSMARSRIIGRMWMPYLMVVSDWLAGTRSGGGNPGSYRSEVRLFTTTSPRAMLSHFEPQILAAGFRPVLRVSDAVQSIARFDSTPAASSPMIAVISLTVIPGSPQVDALLEVFKPDGRTP